MISKKVITQTIPTVYSDNEDFMISRSTYGLSGNNSKIKSTSILNNQSNKLNSFGYASSNSSNNSNGARKMNFSLNNGMSSKNKADANSLKPVNYFDFHLKKSQENLNTSKKSDYTESKHKNSLNKQHQSKSIENESPTAVPTTPFQQNFQKYVIERHVNHFNHRQQSINNNSNASKPMEKKIFNDESSKSIGGNILKGNMYNKSYFYNESLSDTKSLADEKFEKVNTNH